MPDTPTPELEKLARETVHGAAEARRRYPFWHSISCSDCVRVTNALREAYALGEARTRERLRSALTNEVIRAVGSLAQQRNVCREQDGKAVFVTGMEAAREYLMESMKDACQKEASAQDLSTQEVIGVSAARRRQEEQ